MSTNNSISSVLSAAENVEYWEKLVPGCTITDTPFSEKLPDYEITTAQRDLITRRVIEDGYFDLDAAFSATKIQLIANAIRAVVGVGLPPIFCFVFDETWQIFSQLNQVVEPILDPGFKLQTGGIWGWYIDGEDAGFRPHRDLFRLNDEPDGRPSSLTIWVPLVDATPLSGCLYVLPTSRDPNHPDNLRAVSIDDIQSVRAVPAKAGSAIGFTASTIHWSGRRSHFATEQRISIAVSYNRADHSKHAKPELLDSDYSQGTRLAIAPETIVTFGDRLNYIGEAIWEYKSRVPLFYPDAAAALFDYCRDHYASPGVPADVEAKAAGVITQSKKIVARQFWQAGRHNDALMVMRQYCKDYPEDADGWQTRGRIESLLNQLDMAENCYRKAISIQSGLPEAHKGLAEVLRQKQMS